MHLPNDYIYCTRTIFQRVREKALDFTVEEFLCDVVNVTFSASLSLLGASICGNDESTGDHTPTDAADPSTAGPIPPATPSPPTTTTGSHASAGEHA